jgi:hypothetical protein
MKAQDPSRAFGAVIGKDVRSLKDGQGLIPVLIALTDSAFAVDDEVDLFGHWIGV